MRRVLVCIVVMSLAVLAGAARAFRGNALPLVSYFLHVVADEPAAGWRRRGTGIDGERYGW